MAGDWSSPSSAESRYFDACCEVLESARELERFAASPLGPGATAASLGCLSAALDSLANASVMAAESANVTADGDPVPARLLHGVSQNLRMASLGCERGRASLDEGTPAS